MFVALSLFDIRFETRKPSEQAGRHPTCFSLIASLFLLMAWLLPPGGSYDFLTPGALGTNGGTTQASIASPVEVQQEGRWSEYSVLPNHILCAASGPDGEVWLGTFLGLKRLDRDGHLIHLYTRGDGLAGDTVLAVAVEPKDAWCLTLSDMSQPRTYGLCHLDRAKARWETLRTVPIPPIHCSDQAGAPSFIATGAPGHVAFVLGNVARSEVGTAIFWWNNRARTWRDVPWGAGHSRPSGCFRFPEPLWAIARHSRQGADEVWIGTVEGVCRYDAAQDVWTDFFRDRSAVGGAVAPDGLLWLSTVVPTDTRYQPPQASLRLVQFDADAGAARAEFDAADYSGLEDNRLRSGTGLPFPGVRESVIPADDGSAVWLIPRPEVRVFSSRTRVLTLLKFETKTQRWGSDAITADAGGADLPDDVLRQAATDDFLGAALVRRLLPQWLNAGSAELPVTLDSIPGHEPAPGIEDHTGPVPAVWTVTDQNVLVCSRKGDAPQRFPLPGKAISVTPSIRNIALLGGDLFVMTSDALWQRTLLSGPWIRHPLPTASGFFQSSSSGGLQVVEGHLGVQVDDTLCLFDPVTGSYGAPAKISLGSQMLGTDGRSLWFTDGSDHVLSRMSVTEGSPLTNQSSELVQVDTEDRHMDPELFAVAGGKAWCFVQEGIVQDGITSLYGLDLMTHHWDAPEQIAGHVGHLSAFATTEGIYVTVGSRLSAQLKNSVGDTYRQDRRTGQWSQCAIAPPPQGEGIEADTLEIAGVDARYLWLVNTEKIGLLRWDRARQVWDQFPAAVQPVTSSPVSPSAVARQGSEFYVASNHGVWKFDSETTQWTQIALPGDARELQVGLGSVDANSVWALCSEWGGGQTLPARFDKQTQRWTLWDASDGFPTHGQYMRIVGAGAGALAITDSGDLFRLNPVTNRWDNLTPALDQALAGGASMPDLHLHIPLFVPDQKAVWVRGYVQWAKPGTPGSAPLNAAPVAVRYETTRGVFERIEPPPASAAPPEARQFWGDGMAIKDGAAWLIGWRGLWRYDQRGKKWRYFAIPVDLPMPQGAQMSRLEVDQDGSLWIIGRDTMLRFSTAGLHF